MNITLKHGILSSPDFSVDLEEIAAVKVSTINDRDAQLWLKGNSECFHMEPGEAKEILAIWKRWKENQAIDLRTVVSHD